ncbi:hypothetical protein [Hymenobacter sp. DG01]|uniref:hypothetical protein n=1 Tax=Hymenobacter sp. DG01 TaxID=2584940 RepID=UPI0011206A3C|nr:hypothetical protein [Hymenobacter sp. DG01]
MRWLLRLVLGSWLVLLVYLNTRLYYQPTLAPTGPARINQDVVQQLQFLRTKMHAGAAEQMQALYPEGFVYQNALYALTWIELLPHLPVQSALRQEAQAEADWALRQIQSPEGRLAFDPALPLPYGAFYQGWSAYVLGRYLAALPTAQHLPADVTHFQRQCAAIATALRAGPTPYPESYSGAAWPADGVMCVAALAWHDRLLPAAYRADLSTWLRTVDQHLDSRQMIPHQTSATTGGVVEAARGSSQSQLLNFLLEIDSAYAQTHFQRYRAHFLTARLGLPGVQESARGAQLTEDIDSGPVIWGVGGAASIVGRRTMQRYGDTATALGLRNSVEAFGMPWSSAAGKRYLFGALPIADAFIAWSNSLETSHAMHTTQPWRRKFQLLSGVVAAGCLLGLWGLRRFRRG